jgi:hypothetical protein
VDAGIFTTPLYTATPFTGNWVKTTGNPDANGVTTTQFKNANANDVVSIYAVLNDKQERVKEVKWG